MLRKDLTYCSDDKKGSVLSSMLKYLQVSFDNLEPLLSPFINKVTDALTRHDLWFFLM